MEEAEQTWADEIITIPDDETLGQDDGLKGLFQAGAKQKFKNTQEKSQEFRKEGFKTKLTIKFVKDKDGLVTCGEIKNKTYHLRVGSWFPKLLRSIFPLCES